MSPLLDWRQEVTTLTLHATSAHILSGRVVICGAISQYNETATEGPSNYLSLLVNRGRMQGFVVFDYAKQYGEALKQVRQPTGCSK